MAYMITGFQKIERFFMTIQYTVNGAREVLFCHRNRNVDNTPPFFSTQNGLLYWHIIRCMRLANYTSTGNKYALIREMRLIKSAFFNAGILRTAAKYALNSE